MDLFRVVFLMGKPESDENQNIIFGEASMYRDIVQGKVAEITVQVLVEQ